VRVVWVGTDWTDGTDCTDVTEGTDVGLDAVSSAP
jgi:hypothetical protein